MTLLENTFSLVSEYYISKRYVQYWLANSRTIFQHAMRLSQCSVRLSQCAQCTASRDGVIVICNSNCNSNPGFSAVIVIVIVIDPF